MTKPNQLQEFYEGFLQALFFSTSYDVDGEKHLDSDFDFSDLSSDAAKLISRDCSSFLDSVQSIVNDYDLSLMGGDYFFVRNGHGVGFKDRDCYSWRAAEYLTKLASEYKELYIEVGNDNRIHVRV